MATVTERVRKRLKYPVDLDGDIVYVRALRGSEFRTAHQELANNDAGFGYALGCGLLNDDGSQAFTRDPGESAEAFGNRVLDELDLSLDVRSYLTDKILRLSRGDDIEKLKKSS